jgi:hypothetical protein
MNAERRLELQISLQRELERQTVEYGLDVTGRIAWLLDQVENYVARKLGMPGGLRAISPNDELFRMIEIGAEVTTAELQAIDPGPFADAWREFVQVVTEAGLESRKIDSQRLEKSFAVVRSRFPSVAH